MEVTSYEEYELECKKCEKKTNHYQNVEFYLNTYLLC